MTEKAKKPTNLMEQISQWPAGRKISLAAVVLVCLAFFAVLILQARVAEYGLLFANLSSGDAAAVIERLKERKIPYRLEDGGKAVHIPAEKVHEARLELAGAGLPTGGGVGFEIFDRQSFGMTDFAQKVNYRRALEGELARTISSLAPVEAARVHLALPEKRLFREQQQDSTASVIVKLVPGRELGEAQIQGILHLVAGSVEGLGAEKVTVIDANGRVLSRRPADSLEGPLTPGMFDTQQLVEKRLESRAQALLDTALGPGNSLVKVTATLDFSQRERLEESYDPVNTAVRSEQVVQEKSGSETAGGIPGVQSNLPGGAAGAAGSQSTSRTEETTNYEVSKVVSKLVESVGTVKSLSVAVLVSDRMVPGEGGGEPTYVPRNEKEVQSIERMVTSALGIDQERGDQLVVVAMPFENAFAGEPFTAPAPLERVVDYLPLVKYGLILLGAALLYLLLVRPVVRTLQGEKRLVEHYKTVEQLEAELSGQVPMLGAPSDPAARLRQEVLQAKTSPSQVIKTWLKES